jgi:hypothetical protein
MALPITIIDEADDGFSEAFLAFARERGIRCQRMRLDDFALAVTIEHTAGAVEVRPDGPLLLRPLRGAPPEAGEPERFLWNERLAAAWSAAALSPAPVLNRPDEWGWGCRTAYSGALLERRSGLPSAGLEVFWCGAPPDEADAMFHQDMTTWRILERPAAAAMVRSRRLPSCRGWDQVIVVGARAFRASEADVGGQPLEEMSLAVARRLGLAFATVSWGLPADGAAAVLGRVNAFPGLHECAPVWSDVRAALLSELAA